VPAGVFISSPATARPWGAAMSAHPLVDMVLVCHSSTPLAGIEVPPTRAPPSNAGWPYGTLRQAPYHSGGR